MCTVTTGSKIEGDPTHNRKLCKFDPAAEAQKPFIYPVILPQLVLVEGLVGYG